MIFGLTEEQLKDELSGFFIPGTVSSGEELRTAIAKAIVSNNEAIKKTGR